MQVMKLRIIGYTDTVNECDCCGKTGLKVTYVMANDDNDEFYYGSECGAKAAGWSTDEFKANIKKIKAEQKTQLLIAELEKSISTIKHSMYKGAILYNEFEEQKIVNIIYKKKLDLKYFVTKYGRLFEENDNYVAYKFGHVVHLFDK